MHHTTRLARWPLAFATLTCLASAAGAGMTCEKLDTCPCVFDMVESTIGRGWVGISMSSDGNRWMISEVAPEGPAERAGLLVGDRLLAMNGVPMSREHEDEIGAIYRAMVPDSKLTYTVDRDGQKRDVTITLGHLPEKILAIVLGQQLLESYTETTGKRIEPAKPPHAPAPPEPPDGDRPPKG